MLTYQGRRERRRTVSIEYKFFACHFQRAYEGRQRFFQPAVRSFRLYGFI